VALKIIKHGMDTRQVVARFEAERQALALMNHPTVAKVYDAGTTPRGRPYFVMEYVPGVPITEHCDRHKLTTEERLNLFLQVCDGVQHSHQKAIIHRDLKPSNILVALVDGKAAVKIIDFGVAKATAQKLTERTLFTELGVLIGTPEYMSPEQAEMTGQDIDTRSDIYSLGVVLYELLVGTLPFEPKELRKAGFDAIRAKIREEDPPKPSNRVSTLGDDRSAESAKLRQVDARTLQRTLRGDLDWITMKTLEKNRMRRYGSMQELAADIQRHLSCEPVLASPPSVAYKTRKFVSRHRLLVGAAAVVVVSLLLGAVTTSIGFVRASRERDRALTAESLALAESENRQAMVGFLTLVLSWANPARHEGEPISLGEALDRAHEEVARDGGMPPLVEASIRRIVGSMQADRGDLHAAEQNLRAALEIAETDLEATDPLTLKLLNSLGHTMLLAGQYELAMSVWDRELAARLETASEDDPDYLTNVQNKAAAFLGLERYAEAEPLLLQALEGRTRVHGKNHSRTMTTLANLAYLFDRTGRDEEAEALLLDLFDRRSEILGPNDPRTLATSSNLADFYGRRGRFDEADLPSRRAYEGMDRVYEDDHAYLLEAMRVRAEILNGLERLAEAEQLAQDCYRRTAAMLTPESKETRKVATLLAILHDKQGNATEAELWRRRAEEPASGGLISRGTS